MTLTIHVWQIVPLVLAILGLIATVGGLRSRPSGMYDFTGPYAVGIGILLFVVAGLWCLAFWLGGRHG